MRATIIEPKRFPLAGITISLLFWILDSFLDTFVFNNNLALTDNFFTSDPNELWMRLTFVSVVVLFSLHARHLYKINHALQEQINSKNEVLDEHTFLETVDPVTLLINKRKLYELLEYEIEKDKRYKAGFSIMFCSIDHFNKIKNIHNLDTTNNLLRNIALQLVKTLRTSDVVSLWEEEYFLMLIPNKTAEKTRIIAKKLQSCISQIEFDQVGKINLSFGITQYIEDDNKVSIVNRANKALSLAKENEESNVEIAT